MDVYEVYEGGHRLGSLRMLLEDVTTITKDVLIRNRDLCAVADHKSITILRTKIQKDLAEHSHGRYTAAVTPGLISKEVWNEKLSCNERKPICRFIITLTNVRATGRVYDRRQIVVDSDVANTVNSHVLSKEFYHE